MRTSILLLATLASAGIGCGSSAATTDADVITYDCAADTRAQTYAAGLQVVGASAKMSFSLVDASPAPPARGNNTWTLQLNAMTASVSGSGSGSDVIGAAITDASINATPFMPDHGHGTPILVGITNQGGGMYQLTPVNLWMPGYWVTTLAVTSPTGGSDTAQFKFCLAE